MRFLVIICVVGVALAGCSDVETLDDLGRKLDPLPELDSYESTVAVVAEDDEITQTTLDDNSGGGEVAGAGGTRYHIVRDGETAESIAGLYSVSETELSSWNGLDSENTVQTGQQLLIPFSEEAVVAVADEAVADETVAEDKPASPPAKQSKFLRPVDGPIKEPYSDDPNGNEGIDFSTVQGTPVRAADDGVVALTSASVNDTTIILVRHDDEFYTVYSNVNAPQVAKGDTVRRGETIGQVASDFVHFEVRKGIDAVDPTPYISD